jgi:hypothetical protein
MSGATREPRERNVGELIAGCDDFRICAKCGYSAKLHPSPGAWHPHDYIKGLVEELADALSELVKERDGLNRKRRGDLLSATARVARLDLHHDQRNSDGEDCGPAYVDRASVLAILHDIRDSVAPPSVTRETT